jgi:hypothetical protein
MDLGALFAQVMDLMVKAKDLKEAVESIHQEIQKLITTKVEVDTISIKEED